MKARRQAGPAGPGEGEPDEGRPGDGQVDAGAGGAAAGGAGGDGAEPSATPAPEQPLPTRVPAASALQPRSASADRPGADRPGADQRSGGEPAPGAEEMRPAGPGGLIAPAGLSGRLMALARMIQIGGARSGRAGFSKKLLADAEAVLGRAGERMRLSSGHTVVVLAGGTGSGKSSLFNRMAGAAFSTVGVTRPVTRDAHACIWGDIGSGALLDWLGVPARYRYSRESALGTGEQDLAGLVLLDLPDHDSVMSHATDLVDRMISQADVMVWVLDPQKYADAAVHRRFLVPLAGHSDVISVVLNQADLLSDAEVDDCVSDLRRLLDSEELTEVQVLVTSARTGAGLDGLRKVLGDAVVARRSAASRISADVDRVVKRFQKYGGGLDDVVTQLPAASQERLTAQFAMAAGVTAVGDSLRSARELHATDYVGWPVAWLAQRVTGRDPVRKMRLGAVWNDLRSVTAGPSGAQQAEIDNSLTELGDELAGELPDPWSQTVRTAVRSRADKIPAALGQAIGECLPAENSIAWWWRLAGAWQGLLIGGLGVGLAWMVTIAGVRFFAANRGVFRLLSDVTLLPWIGALTVAMAVIGALSESACMALVRREAERERIAVTAQAGAAVVGVARELAILPAEQELSELGRFRDEFLIASRERPATRD